MRLGASAERLASGVRINRAADDAAGLAVAETLNAKHRIARQAMLNAGDGLSLTNIQAGALGQLGGILQRQLELAEQAANGTYSAPQRAALNLEAVELSSEFNRIIESTEFNGSKVFAAGGRAVTLMLGETREDMLTIPALTIFSPSDSAGGSGSSDPPEPPEESFSWDGTFGVLQSAGIATGSGAFPSAGDLDGDGDLDIVLGNVTQNVIQLFSNDGNGGLTAGSTYALTAGNRPNDTDTADFNNDGRLDILTKNSDGNTSVFLNNGGGYTRTDYGAGLASFGNVSIADFNGDGKLDYAAAGGGAQVGVFLNSGSGSFTVSYLPVTHTSGVATGDVTGDGITDIVANFDGDDYDYSYGGPIPPSSVVFRGTGAGTFVNQGSVAIGGYSMEIADMNGDGKNDLVGSNTEFTDLRVALGNGNGTFQAAAVYPTGLQGVGTNLADFNGDNRPDVIVSGLSSPTLLFLNNGNGQLTSSNAANHILTTYGADAADLNGDGVLDLFNAHGALFYSFGGATAAAGGAGVTGSLEEGSFSFDLLSAASARRALDVVKTCMDEISSVTAVVGALQSRIESCLNVLAEKTVVLKGAESRIRDADIAHEMSNYLSLVIQQQATTSLLAAISGQDKAIAQALLYSS